MPMVAATLKAGILSKLAAQFGAPEDAGLAEKFAQAIAEAVVEHIAANALATLTSATVTTGVGAGGLVTGTGTVT